MAIDDQESKNYLLKLYTMTQGDTEAQVSMYDVGATLGLARSEAGRMAEDLMVQGWVELKTLSGGISITPQGLDTLQLPGSSKATDNSLQLGNGPVLTDQGRQAVGTILTDIKTNIAQSKASYPQLEEVVIDIKTIETQMLSPHPKVEVVREVLRSLHNTLTSIGMNDLSAKINSMLSS